HGTRHHLERHAELAREAGVADVMVIENGDVATVNPERVAPGGRVPVGRVATWEGAMIGEAVLRDRRLLARGGALSIGLAFDSRGRLAGKPSIQARGVSLGDDEASTLRFVALEIAKALEDAPGTRDDDANAEIARLAARRAVEARTGRKPVCLVTVVRV